MSTAHKTPQQGHPQSKHMRNNKFVTAQTLQPLSGRYIMIKLKIKTKTLASWGQTNTDGLRAQVFPVLVAGQRLQAPRLRTGPVEGQDSSPCLQRSFPARPPSRLQNVQCTRLYRDGLPPRCLPVRNGTHTLSTPAPKSLLPQQIIYLNGQDKRKQMGLSLAQLPLLRSQNTDPPPRPCEECPGSHTVPAPG